jgi:PmbA protein
VDLRDVAQSLVERARRAGADAADAVVGESDGLEVGIRLGEVEKLKRSRERRAGLRVFVGNATAIASSGDLAAAGLDTLVDDALALARVTAPDAFGGLPDAADLATDVPDLGLYDARVETMEADDAFARCHTAEEAARGASPEITNSEGAEFGCGGGQVALASTHGFVGGYGSSSFGLSAVPIATRDGQMQRDYWYSSSRRLDGLEPADAVGREAARRTLRRLGARRLPTGEYPIVFDPEVAASLLRHLAGAVAGSSLYRRASYLLDKLGETIAAPGVTIVDDPLRPGGLGSRPFDGEGVASTRRTIVDRGVLASYLLDTYSARRLGLRTTGHATRAAGDAPGVSSTNFYLEAGSHTPEAIVASVARGIYVTELIGFGVNGVTGDYSRGAAGLAIEHGELTHPVEEITIAGNLLDMFRAITMVGNDLRFRGATAAPTLKIERMTVAGT